MTIRSEVENDDQRHLVPGITATVNLEFEPRTMPLLQKAVGEDSHARSLLEQGRVLAVPVFSAIETGEESIVYRESLPGVYEGTLVSLGPRMAGADGVAFYPVLSGLAPGDRVVTSGSFLVDAETRLNPAAGSIYFGGSGGGNTGGGVTTVRPSTPEDTPSKIAAAMAKLSPADRAVAQAQGSCPVLDESPLGAMGVPVKVKVDGQDVFVCCQNCVKAATKEPDKTLRRVAELKDQNKKGRPTPAPADQPTAPTATDPKAAKIKAALAKLSSADRKAAELQKECPINEGSLLGSMGVPIKVTLGGQSVYLCCPACKEDALADPRGTLEKVKRLRQANTSERKP
jgi:hypothetical protein